LALSDAVLAALALKRYSLARNYAHQLLQVNPWNVDYHYYLARVCGEERDWPGCWEACQRALALEPAHVATRTLLVSYYVAQEQRVAAQAEFDRLLALDPPDKEERRRWFQELLSPP
jgi:tetratricopeptide (TPR) repeat protein